MENEISKKILEKLEVINGRLDRLEVGQARLQSDISIIKEDIEEIKEHAEITRSATNELVAWADQASPTVHVNFPYRKKENV